MNWEKISLSACEVAKEAGAFIREERMKFNPGQMVEKGKRNLVSYVDVEAEKIIVTGLREILPDAGFITEENTIARNDHSQQWIIDPLDGTTNFIHGVPPFAVSIALQQENELTIGVIYEVNLDECFYAWKGGGAFLNGKKISVTATNSLRHALNATGFPYESFPLMERYFSSLRYLFNNTHGVRRLGSAAVDLAYVACGRFDAFFEYNLNAWDVAAGALLVQEAGGRVTDMNGGNDFLFGKTIVASNSNLYNEFFNAVVNPQLVHAV